MEERISRLNLDDVRDRVYAKYDVTASDSELAVECLRCLLDAKRARPNELVILPQIADWAWHELILDTKRYRDVCSQIFGRFLHHIRVRADSDCLREAFRNSMKMMEKVYGLKFGDCSDEWHEAGWNTPIYRLRDPIRAQHHELPDRGLPNRVRFLSWLPQRIVQRFGLPIDVAELGVREYCELFLSSRLHSVIEVPDAKSALCEIAWEEHVLWTQRYMQDCYKLLGHFLEHRPRAIFNDSTPQAPQYA